MSYLSLHADVLQVIARIHTPQKDVRGLIHSLLCRIGRHHPQARHQLIPYVLMKVRSTFLLRSRYSVS